MVADVIARSPIRPVGRDAPKRLFAESDEAFDVLSATSLNFWGKHDDILTETVGPDLFVTQFNDKSGNGHDMPSRVGASSTGKRARYQASNVDANNRPTVLWTDNLNKEVYWNTTTGFDVKEVVAVMAWVSISGNSTFPRDVQLFATTGNQFPIRFTQNAATLNAASDVPTVSINGGPQTSTLLPLTLSVCRFTYPAVRNGFWSFGGQPGADTPGWQGPISELLVFSQDMSASYWNGLLAHLTTQYGI
ncbi:MAG: hypothetical protein ABJN26_16045 [Stappiaceae bacterium]